MARLDRQKRAESPKAKVNRPNKTSNEVLKRLLILNLLLATLSCAADYEKYVELFKKLLKFLYY